MDIQHYNSKAWDKLTETKDKWTLPVDEATIAEARKGHWEIQLTSTKPAPRNWFPETLNGLKILCLASGGGQQGPILAAAGAEVTVFDNSANQLAQDQFVTEREALAIKTVQGDMTDLSCFPDECFDFIVNPCSNLFSDQILLIWQEASRVLKKGGTLVSGFLNPLVFIFDLEDYEKGKLTVRHKIPFSDVRDLPEEELKTQLTNDNKPVCFGHTLHDQIQGQIEAGLVITGLFEDSMGEEDALHEFIDSLIATRAVKISLE